MMYFASDNLATTSRLKSLGLKSATYLHHSDFVSFESSGRGFVYPLRVYRILANLRDRGDADTAVFFNAEWDESQHQRFGDGLFYMDPGRSTPAEFERTVDRVQTLMALAKSMLTCPVTFTDTWMLPFWNYGRPRWESGAEASWQAGLQLDQDMIYFQQWCRDGNEQWALDSLDANLERARWWNSKVGPKFPRCVQLSVVTASGQMHTPEYLSEAVRKCSSAGWDVLWWLRGIVETGTGLVRQDNLGPDSPTGNRMCGLIETAISAVNQPNESTPLHVEAQT